MGVLGFWDFKEHFPTGWGWGSQDILEEPRWIWEGSYGSLRGLGFQGTPYGLGLEGPKAFWRGIRGSGRDFMRPRWSWISRNIPLRGRAGGPKEC